MGCEAQEARQTTETELQEVSAELNQLLETGSDGSDIGRNPCPRLGYHIVATLPPPSPPCLLGACR